MGISVGRNNQYISGSHRQGPVPQSTGFADSAQRRVDLVASMSGRRAIEAVRTDGHVCHVWDRLPRGGIPCSCGGWNRRSSSSDVGDFSSPFDVEDARMERDEELGLTPQGADNPDIGSGISLRLRGNLIRSTGETINTARHNDAIPPSNSGSDLDASPVTDLSVPEQTIDHEFPIQTESLGDLISLITGSDGHVCGICYGTGYVDGYRLVDGTRIVLDAVGSYPGVAFNFIGADVDRNSRPMALNFSNVRESAEWTVEIPLFIEVLAVRAFDNDEPLEGFMLEGKTSLGSWTPLTKEWLLTVSGQKINVRCKLVENRLMEGFSTMTHVELILRQRDSLRVQVPQLQQTLNAEQQDPVIYTEFELEPTVGLMHRESVIEVPATGRIFKVTEVVNKQTAKQQIWGVTGQMRVVQPTEKMNQMRISSNRDAVTYPHRGLERVQGGLTAGLVEINSQVPNPQLEAGLSEDDLLNRDVASSPKII